MYECRCPKGFRYNFTSRTCGGKISKRSDLVSENCLDLKKKTGQHTFSRCPVVSDMDECEMSVCDGICINTVGSYECHCDGRLGLRLAEDSRYCERIPVCVDLYDYKHPEMLYLGEQFSGLPAMFLRYRLPENTKYEVDDGCKKKKKKTKSSDDH